MQEVFLIETLIIDALLPTLGSCRATEFYCFATFLLLLF